MRFWIHAWAAPAVVSCLAMVAGCAATAESAGGLLAKLAGRKTPEDVLDIKTPEDRATELRQLAKDAHARSPEEQIRITAELANEIRSEEDPAMRRNILRTLAEYRTPQALDMITAGLQDSDLEVRRVACEALGRQGGPQAVQHLVQASTADTSVDVRIAAVRALGETKDKAALAPLADALADSDPAVQFRAAESLRLISGRDFGANVQAWREYARTGSSSAPEVNLAERLRRAIF
jgi:HEAT repeat protein